MNDAKHTKGPWIHSKHGFNVLTADEMHSICAVHAPNPGYTSEKDVQEHLANARLIAAAPDLLEALRDLIQAHTVQMGPKAVKLRVELAEAAIRKAEGK